METLVTFAKDPRLGHSKSRLARTVGADRALAVAQALLSDTLETVQRIGEAQSGETATSICFAPDDQQATKRFAVYGPKISSEPQRGDTLGERLIHCFDDWFTRGSKRVVVIGTDCPTVTPADVEAAFAALHKSDVVIGPAADGGYYLVGLASPRLDLFQEIDWSGPDVLAQTIAVIRANELTLRLLPTKSDLDTADDLRPVIGQLDAYAAAGDPRGRATHVAIKKCLENTSNGLTPFEVVSFDQIESVECPCGRAKRAFANASDFPATVHQTVITLDAKPHYHNAQTEVYVILECDDDAALELNGERFTVHVGSAILIRPGCVHRAVGQMKVLIICSPKFDAQDEFVVTNSQ